MTAAAVTPPDEDEAPEIMTEEAHELLGRLTNHGGIVFRDELHGAEKTAMTELIDAGYVGQKRAFVLMRWAK